MHCLLCIVYPASRATRKGVLRVNVLYSVLSDPLDACIPAFMYKTYRMFKQKKQRNSYPLVSTFNVTDTPIEINLILLQQKYIYSFYYFLYVTRGIISVTHRCTVFAVFFLKFFRKAFIYSYESIPGKRFFGNTYFSRKWV